MALINKGILGTPQGRIGNIVGYTRKGQGIIQSNHNITTSSINTVLSQNASSLSYLAYQYKYGRDVINRILDKTNLTPYYSYNVLLKGLHQFSIQNITGFICFAEIIVNEISSPCLVKPLFNSSNSSMRVSILQVLEASKQNANFAITRYLLRDNQVNPNIYDAYLPFNSYTFWAGAPVSSPFRSNACIFKIHDGISNKIDKFYIMATYSIP